MIYKIGPSQDLRQNLCNSETHNIYFIYICQLTQLSHYRNNCKHIMPQTTCVVEKLLNVKQKTCYHLSK